MEAYSAGNRACHSSVKSAAVLTRQKHATFELYTVLGIKDHSEHGRVALAVILDCFIRLNTYSDSRGVLVKFLDSKWPLFSVETLF